MAVRALSAASLADGDADLLLLAAAHAPRLPVDDLDVLLIDRMGKDISGAGIDTNVIGRVMIHGEPEPPAPRISMIAVPRPDAGVARQRHRDGSRRRDHPPPADAIDHDVTRTNVVTSGFLLRGKLPVVADDDRHAWELCLRGAGVVDTGTVRAARIVDTLHCSELWISDAVLGELPGDIEVLGRDVALHAPDGRLAPFGG